MKKKWLLGLAALTAAFAIVGLAGCVDEPPETPDNGDGTQTEQPDNGGNTGGGATDGNETQTEQPGDKTTPVQESLDFQKIAGKGEYRITGIGNVSNTEIVIPATYRNLPVTEIDDYAFYYCRQLTSVTFEENSRLTSIGNYAFYGCNGLTSIEIPTRITSIGGSAFYGCYRLTGVYITDIAAWCNIDFCDSVATPLRYANNLYVGNRFITELVIPISVSAIKEHAFSGCSSLTNIEIPDSVTSIGDRAFQGCSGLTSIEIPASVTSIGAYAFDGCDNLQYTIENGLKYLGNVNNPYLWLMGTESITAAAINENCRFIGDGAFWDCKGLTNIEIPASVTSIGRNAFQNCSSLTSITFSENSQLTTISEMAFAYCDELANIEIPANVTRIDGAFYNCGRLTSITFNGTKAQWNSIRKADAWNYNVPATKVVCTDGEVEL